MGLQNKLEELERQAWFRAAPPDEQNGLRLELQRRYSAQRQGRAQSLQAQYGSVAAKRGGDPAELAAARGEAVRSTVAMRQQAQAEQTNPIARGITAVGSPLVAGAAGFADTGTFGNAANLASLLPAATGQMGFGEANEAARARLGAAREMHPVATAAGNVAGVFGKTLFSGVTGAAGRIAAPIAKLSAKAAERAFQSSLAQYAAKLVPQVAANVAGSGMSIGALNMLSDLGNGPGVGERVANTIRDTFSPLNLAVSGIVGAGQAALRVAPIPERVSLLKRLEREMPGFKATPDMYRDDSIVVGALSQIGQSNVPFASATASKLARESVIKPLQQSVGALKGLGGLADDIAARAEQPIRSAIGTPQLPGTLKQGVMAQQGVARAAEAGTPVPRATLLGFLQAAVKFGRDEGRGAGQRGSALGNVLSDVRGEFARQQRALHANKNVRVPWTAKDLLGVKTRLDEVIGWEKLASQGMIATREFSVRDVREAKKLRDVIQVFIQTTLPQIDSANAAQTRISRIVDTFSTPQTIAAIENAPDGALLREVFNPRTFFSHTVNGKQALGRWDAFKDATTAEARQMASAGYAKMYLDEMAAGAPERAIPSVWSPLLSKLNQHDDSTSSMFNRKIADAAVPGLRDWVRDRAQMMELFRRGMGSALGSQTEPRHALLAGLGAAAATPYALYEVFADNKDSRVRAFLGALGTVGTLALARSAMSGGGARQLNALATGAPVLGPTTAAAALAGNDSPLKNAANSLIEAVPPIASSTAGALARLGQSR